MTIDSIGFGLIIPVLPNLITELSGLAMSEAAAFGGWLLAVFALAQFFAGPVIGNLSDAYGRRPVILIAMTAFGLDYLVMALAPNLTWLFVGRVIAGVAGAVYGPASAYLADILPEEDRAKGFGMIGAAFGAGFILGPALGGALAGFGVRAPFFAAAALALLNAFVGYFVLKESLARENRRAFNPRIANPFTGLSRLARLPGMAPLLMVQTLWLLAHQVYPATWSFFMKLRFDLPDWAIGLSLAYVGLLMTVVQGGAIGPLVKRLGEHRALMLGLVIAICEFVGYAVTPVAWGLYVVMTIGALEGLVYPAMSSMMSHAVPKDQQGELQGSISSLQSLSEIIGPAVMSQTLARMTGPDAPFHFPGAAFALSALLALACLVVLVTTVKEKAAPELTARP